MSSDATPNAAALLAQAQDSMLRANATVTVAAYDMMLPALGSALHALSQLALQGIRPGGLQAPPPPWDGAKLEQMLWSLLANLRAAGSTAFPFAGTLLGLERDGKLLPNDKDADLGVWLEDLGLTFRLMQQMGFKLADNVPPAGNMVSVVDPQTGWCIDLFGIRRDPVLQRLEGGVWFYGKPASHQRVTHYPWFTLAQRSGPAGDVWWPQPPGVLLVALYGDWRIPVPEWDSLVSCPAVQTLNLHWRCCALKQLCDRWIRGDLARTRRLLDQIGTRAGWDAQLTGYRDALDAALAIKSPSSFRPPA